VERVAGVGDSNQRIEDSRVMTRSTWERWFVDFVGSKRSSKPYLFTNPSPRMLTDQHSSCMVPLSSCLLSISEPLLGLRPRGNEMQPCKDDRGTLERPHEAGCSLNLGIIGRRKGGIS
jgi:hypothetical protein